MIMTINTHELKTINPFFQDIWDNKKKFEIRYNDRHFQLGDTIVLREYLFENKQHPYTGRSITIVITYILDDKTYLSKGYIAFCFDLITKTDIK